MKLIGYSLSLMACKDHNGRLEVKSQPAFTTKAKSPHSAKVIGLSMALGKYPEEEGWTEHTCSILRIELDDNGNYIANYDENLDNSQS